MNLEKPLSNYYTSIKEHIRFYQNIGCILDKNEQDGNILLIGKTFENIFQKEILYAVTGMLKRTEKIKVKKPLIRFENSFPQKFLDF